MTAETQALDNSRAAARSNIELNSEFDLAYVAMNFFSTIVACYGLFEDSPAVVIGAMSSPCSLVRFPESLWDLLTRTIICFGRPFGRWQEAAWSFTGLRSCSV